jgi:hypothetical protein
MTKQTVYNVAIIAAIQTIFIVHVLLKRELCHLHRCVIYLSSYDVIFHMKLRRIRINYFNHDVKYINPDINSHLKNSILYDKQTGFTEEIS